MITLAKLIPANGYVPYAGADISAVVNGYTIYWACSSKLPSGSQATVVFVQTPGKPTEALVPKNEKGLPLLNARGQFTVVGNKVYLAAWDKTIDSSPQGYIFEVDDIKLSIDPIPQPTPVPTTNVDQVARDAASAALNKANTALVQIISIREIANAAHTTADIALSKVNSIAAITLDIVWQKINDRLFILINAFESNNRSDVLDTKWQDVLFKKTNDWIYGQLKDRGLIK